MSERPPAALITGVSRTAGIGHAVVHRLADDGHRVVAAGWREYDERMPWGADRDDPNLPGPFYEVDFEDADVTAALLPRVCRDVGPVNVLVLCHCESVDSDVRTTTVESFDRHMAVNARATWQLIRSFAELLDGADLLDGHEGHDGHDGVRRIVSITSDHTAENLPYGASKGAMDRIVLAAAIELAGLGVTANVVNPGATDTGWMSPAITQQVLDRNLQARVGRPSDVANIVSFLCSPEGQWINGQLLHSNGGLH